jgi:hypothetical protein
MDLIPPRIFPKFSSLPSYFFPCQKSNSGFVLNFYFADVRGPLVSGAEADAGPPVGRHRTPGVPRADRPGCRMPLKAVRSRPPQSEAADA